MNYEIGLRSRDASVPVDARTLSAAPVQLRGGHWPVWGRWNHSAVETVATSPQEFVGFTYYQSLVGDPSNPAGGATPTLRTWSWPARFNAIHMNLIPRGPNRGKVMVWNGDLVVGHGCTSVTATPPWDAGTVSDPWWTFQPWAIVDPGEAAVTRFQNFLLPLAPLQSINGYLLAHTLFCAGQCWDANGNLVIAGGARFDTLNGWAHGDYGSMYLWCPTLPAVKAETNGGTQVTFTGSEHYTDGYGSWVQIESQLQEERYYPTSTMLPPLTRPAVAGDHGKSGLLVLGGSYGRLGGAQPFQSETWNSYEAWICDAAPNVGGATWTSGYRKDTNNGANATGVYPGPSTYDAVTNPWPNGDIFKDGLYFYPHMTVLGDGSLFMSGFVHKSASLTNHGTAPGVWSTARGHAEPSGLLNSFRYYGTTVHLTGTDHVDVVYRMGGSQSPIVKLDETKNWAYIQSIDYVTNIVTLDRPHHFVATDLVTLSHAGTPTLPPQITVNTEGSVYGIQLVANQPTQLRLLSGATVIDLTDPGSPIGSNVVIALAQFDPGYRAQAWPELPLDTRSMDQIRFTGPTVQWEQAPPLKLERSLMNVVTLPCGSLIALGGVAINDDAFGASPPSIHPLVSGMHLVHNHDPSSVELAGFIYPFYAEMLPYGKQEWQALTWATSKSTRDYHSTACLLPDGRIFVGGGTRREDFNGYDYEVYEPPYLVADHDHPDSWVPVRPVLAGVPTGVSPTANPAISEDASVLVYDGVYSADFIFAPPANQSLQRRVTRITLTAPGATTHHNDWSARWQELEIVQATHAGNTSTVQFRVPADNKKWLPGFAMLWAISDQGVPSEALWVKFNV